jgi:hypothetical protein
MSTIIPAIVLFFKINSVNIRIISILKKSPLKAMKKKTLKLPLPALNTNIEFKRYEITTDTTNAIAVASIGIIIETRPM